MENKRAYIKPILESETFVPQNYIAACNDVTVTWNIKCNVPYGFGFIDQNGNGKYDRRSERKIATGEGCGIYHTVDLPRGETPKENAMWQPTDRWGDEKGNAFGTYYWVEKSWGNNENHFSIASEGDWHIENHS